MCSRGCCSELFSISNKLEPQKRIKLALKQMICKEILYDLNKLLIEADLIDLCYETVK